MRTVPLEPAAVTGTARPGVHHTRLPLTPAQVLLTPWGRLLAVAVAFVGLAVAATVENSWLLLHLDEPIERFVVEHRTDALDAAFRRISFFGSTRVVLVGGGVLALLAWRRCHSVAVLVVTATLTRPLFEHVLKITVGRERPELDRMVRGVGYSFPSGHVMAAATLWLMVPVVWSLYSRSTRLWWLVASFSLGAVALIGASRVYLGVHWATDVVAGTLAAAMLLTALDAAFRRLHRDHHCHI